MKLWDILADKLVKMHDGCSIVHEQDGVMYVIEKHIIPGGLEYYDYWENGNRLADFLSLDKALAWFLGV